MISMRPKHGGWVHFEGAKGLGRIKHPCFHRGEGLSRRRDNDMPDLFEKLVPEEEAHSYLNRSDVTSKPRTTEYDE